MFANMLVEKKERPNLITFNEIRCVKKHRIEDSMNI